MRRNFSTFDVIVHSGLAASELNKLIQLRSQKVAGIIPKLSRKKHNSAFEFEVMKVI